MVVCVDSCRDIKCVFKGTIDLGILKKAAMLIFIICHTLWQTQKTINVTINARRYAYHKITID